MMNEINGCIKPREKRISLPFMLIGLIALGFFVGPMLIGIINLGNTVGFVFGVLLLIYACKKSDIHAAVKKGFAKKPTRIVITLIFALVLTGVVWAVVVSGMIVSKFSVKPPQNTNAIVLGCGVNGSEPSKMLYDRIKGAKKYLDANPQAKAILSGGQGSDEDISEAECMRRYLVKLGISEDRLLLEDKSTSTEENFAFSKKIMNEQGFGNDVVVITNSFHHLRASMIAKKDGLNTYHVSCRETLLFPTYFLREIFGVTFYMIKGY